MLMMRDAMGSAALMSHTQSQSQQFKRTHNTRFVEKKWHTTASGSPHQIRRDDDDSLWWTRRARGTLGIRGFKWSVSVLVCWLVGVVYV